MSILLILLSPEPGCHKHDPDPAIEELDPGPAMEKLGRVGELGGSKLEGDNEEEDPRTGGCGWRAAPPRHGGRG